MTKHITQEGWQPIATAPKNKPVILYHPPVRRNRPPHDVTLGETVRVDYVGSWPMRPATLWLPLPPPPTQEGGGMNENGTGVPGPDGSKQKGGA